MKLHFTLIALTLLAAAGCSHGKDIPVVPMSAVKSYDPTDGLPSVAKYSPGTTLAQLEHDMGPPADNMVANGKVFSATYYVATNPAPLPGEIPGVTDLRNSPDAVWLCVFAFGSDGKTHIWPSCTSMLNPNHH